MHQWCDGFIAWWKFDQRRCRLHRLWENCDKILWWVREQLLIFIVILVLGDVWVKLSCVFLYRSPFIISYFIRRSPVQWVTICPGITAAVTPTPLTCIILSDRYLDCRSHHLRGVNPDVSEKSRARSFLRVEVRSTICLLSCQRMLKACNQSGLNLMCNSIKRAIFHRVHPKITNLRTFEIYSVQYLDAENSVFMIWHVSIFLWPGTVG